MFIGERTGHQEIYTSDLFFGDVRRSRTTGRIAMTPRWSPDGEKVIYTSYFRSGFPDIFVIDLGSYQRTTFVSFKGTNSGARFSPDGRQVAMVLSGEGEPEIYVSNAQGRGVSRRTHSDLTKASPCWSPDGSRLIFAHGARPPALCDVASGGMPQRVSYNVGRLLRRAGLEPGEPGQGRVHMKVGRQYQIGVTRPLEGHGEQVSHAPFDGVEPSWLPDGRHLVYTARTSEHEPVCILDTETGKSTPVSPTELRARPAGERLVALGYYVAAAKLASAASQLTTFHQAET